MLWAIAGAGIVDGDAREGIAARCTPSRARKVAWSGDTARSEMASDEPDRRMGIEVVRRIGVAVGGGLDRVDERVDAGRGGERRPAS